MKKLIVFFCILLLGGLNYAHSEELEQSKILSWQNNFQEFIKILQDTAKESASEHDGHVEIDDLNKIFLNKTVTWKGTLKYVHKGRPYFKDSFIQISPDTSMSCVMYYPAEDAVKLWEEAEPRSEIIYTGRINAVHADSSSIPYIDLVDVKPVKEIK